MPEEVPQKATPPEGWYEDQDRDGGQRYWDGSTWSEYRTPISHDAPPGYYPDPAGAHSYRYWPGESVGTPWYRRRRVYPVAAVGALVALYLFVYVPIWLIFIAEPAPPVIGLSQAAAVEKVEAAGLEAIVEGSPNQRSKVCEQDPEAGDPDVEVNIRFGAACASVRETFARRARRALQKRQQAAAVAQQARADQARADRAREARQQREARRARARAVERARAQAAKRAKARAARRAQVRSDRRAKARAKRNRDRRERAAARRKAADSGSSYESNQLKRKVCSESAPGFLEQDQYQECLRGEGLY